MTGRCQQQPGRWHRPGRARRRPNGGERTRLRQRAAMSQRGGAFVRRGRSPPFPSGRHACPSPESPAGNLEKGEASAVVARTMAGDLRDLADNRLPPVPDHPGKCRDDARCATQPVPRFVAAGPAVVAGSTAAERGFSLSVGIRCVQPRRCRCAHVNWAKPITWSMADLTLADQRRGDNIAGTDALAGMLWLQETLRERHLESHCKSPSFHQLRSIPNETRRTIAVPRGRQDADVADIR